jgi:hypothetical protein
MSQPTIHHAPDLSDEEIDRILDAMADSFGQQLRSPIMLHRRSRASSTRT